MAADGDDIERLAKRSTKAWTDAQSHHSALREAYRWYMPDLYYEMTGGGNANNAVSNTDDHIFDPTGGQSLEDGASQIAEALHPWDQVWARWVPRTDTPDQNLSMLEDAATKFSAVCNSLLEGSNFDGAAVAAHKQFLLGTGFLLVEIDNWDSKKIRFTATPAYQWAIEADAAGRIQAAFRKTKIRARDCETTLPQGEWSAEVVKLAREQPETEVEVELAIYWEPKLRLWRACHYECKSKHEVLTKTERTSPLIVYRSNLTAGRAWGRGPGLRALPDVKVCNRVVELTLRNAAIAVTGIWQADDDGVLNPNTVRLVAGAIIPKAQGSDGLQPLKAPGDFNVADLILENLRVNIRRAFFVTRIEEREMSATEFAGRLQQQVREQRGTYGQLKGEFAVPIMRRVLDLAVEMGVIEASDFDKFAQLELTGPLAQDVRGAEVEKMQKAVGIIGSIAGPEVAMACLKLQKAVPWMVQQLHAKVELFKDEDELIALGEQVMQMAAQMQAQQLAGPQQPEQAQGAVA